MGAVLKDIGYWILFSLVLALAQLWLIPVGYYLVKKPLTLVDLIGNGSLLFFATTITSRTAGEYFRKVRGHHGWATLVCIFAMLGIVLPSVFAYAFEVAFRVGLGGASSPQGVTVASLSPERITLLSLVLAISGTVFSFGYTLYIRAYGE
jgi:hypothetical protein